MVNYRIALKKPFTDLSKLLIGIAISLVPVVRWVAKGFILECSGLGKSKRLKKMPEWRNFWELFVKGFLSDLILLVYALPAMVIFGLTIASLAFLHLESLTSSEFLAALGAGNLAFVRELFQNLTTPMLLGVVVAFAELLIALYITPIAVLNYVKTKKFSKAFDLKLVFRKAFTRMYFVVWFVSEAITLVVSLLGMIPIVGVAASFFIAGVISYTLFGQVYRKI